jgi:hypothetical protein
MNEYQQGWYNEQGEHFLTLSALQKEVKAKYGLDKRELAKIMLAHQGEIRVAWRVNGYNGKRFIITCLVDVKKIIEKERSGNFKDFR